MLIDELLEPSPPFRRPVKPAPIAKTLLQHNFRDNNRPLFEIRKKGWERLKTSDAAQAQEAGISLDCSFSSVLQSTPTPPITTANAPAKPPIQRENQPRDQLSTKGLSPIRHAIKKGGFIEILDQPDKPLILDLRAIDGRVILISGDGTHVSVFNHPALNALVLLSPVASYTFPSFPPQIAHLYALGNKFTLTLRSRIKRMGFYTHRPNIPAFNLLFSDSNPVTYEISFMKSVGEDKENRQKKEKGLITIRVDRRNKRVTFRASATLTTNKRVLVFPLNDGKVDYTAYPDISSTEQELVLLAFSRSDAMDNLAHSLDKSDITVEPFKPLESLEENGKQSSKTLSLRTIAKAAKAGQFHSYSQTQSREGLYNFTQSESNSLGNTLVDTHPGEQRYLSGVGWIFKLPYEESEKTNERRYKILFNDGEEIMVETGPEFKNSKIWTNGRWIRFEDVGWKLHMRLKSVKEMLDLFC